MCRAVSGADPDIQLQRKTQERLIQPQKKPHWSGVKGKEINNMGRCARAQREYTLQTEDLDEETKAVNLRMTSLHERLLPALLSTGCSTYLHTKQILSCGSNLSTNGLRAFGCSNHDSLNRLGSLQPRFCHYTATRTVVQKCNSSSGLHTTTQLTFLKLRPAFGCPTLSCRLE